MKYLSILLIVLAVFSCSETNENSYQSLFNGKNFQGWEGDTLNTWKIENGMITGGSLDELVPHNEFLCTQKAYANFDLRLKIKLTGSEGFINSGIQFRSSRLSDPDYEMTGYQADFGEDYWASLYDESRRNKTLIAPDSVQVLDWININEWNDYRVLAVDRHIQLFVNGHQSVDYREPDETIPQNGLIGLQIHGGGKAKVFFKDIEIKRLP
ncbi:MAG: DUF1080 domain-containing protein [Cytophagales bacterium]|nr:DUF1080 domain-containing protein [Cytophagales bacterium]